LSWETLGYLKTIKTVGTAFTFPRLNLKREKLCSLRMTVKAPGKYRRVEGSNYIEICSL
jgi:hypothetical protein